MVVIVGSLLLMKNIQGVLNAYDSSGGCRISTAKFAL
jgi:hypothetical protein